MHGQCTHGKAHGALRYGSGRWSFLFGKWLSQEILPRSSKRSLLTSMKSTISPREWIASWTRKWISFCCINAWRSFHRERSDQSDIHPWKVYSYPWRDQSAKDRSFPYAQQTRWDVNRRIQFSQDGRDRYGITRPRERHPYRLRIRFHQWGKFVQRTVYRNRFPRVLLKNAYATVYLKKDDECECIYPPEDEATILKALRHLGCKSLNECSTHLEMSKLDDSVIEGIFRSFLNGEGLYYCKLSL